MFEDRRSKRVMLVAHCVFNQNAKIDRCAYYPGIVKKVAKALINAGVGIIQMPCPELCYLGLDRQVNRDVSTTVESEDTRVGWRMAEEGGIAVCRRLADDLIYQIEEYQKHGFEIVGLIGINGSPTCGVEMSWFNDQEQREPGVFIRVLREALHTKGISLPMRGIKVYKPRKAAAAVMELCAAPRPPEA